MSKRRPLPLQLKIGLAGLAGLGLAWLIPKVGSSPGPSPSGTNATGITAESAPLDTIPAGVSARSIGDVRLFLVRTGDEVAGFQVRSTAREGGRVWWCPRNGWFEAEAGSALYDLQGLALFGTAPANLHRVRVLSSGGTVTIFPKTATVGDSESASPRPAFIPPRCSPSERVG